MPLSMWGVKLHIVTCYTPALHIVKFINRTQKVMMIGIDLFVRSSATDFKLVQPLKHYKLMILCAYLPLLSVTRLSV